MQNAQLASTITQLSFTSAELEVMFAFPLIYSIFQLVVAGVAVGSKIKLFFTLHLSIRNMRVLFTVGISMFGYQNIHLILKS